MAGAPSRAVTADCPAWLSAQYCPDQGDSCNRRHLRTMLNQFEECEVFAGGAVCSFRCPLRHTEAAAAPPATVPGAGAPAVAAPPAPVAPPKPVPASPSAPVAGGEMHYTLLLGQVC